MENPESRMPEDRLSGLMRDGKQTVGAATASQSSRLPPALHGVFLFPLQQKLNLKMPCVLEALHSRRNTLRLRFFRSLRHEYPRFANWA